MKKIYRKPHRYKKKNSILGNRFFWLGILVSFFIYSLFYFLFLSEFFQIKKIIVTGEEKVSKEDIKVFIPSKSIFLIDKGLVRENILNTFPQIAEVEIGQGLPDTLNILVVERLGIANWCQSERCFLVDREGIIFEETISEMELIKIVDKQNKGVFNLGEKVIEKEQLSQILEMEPELKGLEVSVEEFIISSEDKLTATIGEGWEIYFNLQGNIEWQLTKLRAVLEEKIPSEKRENLEYIELRFGNFAPYKYKD